MTNLFSPKQIVGICFLIIGLSVYLATGFNFDIDFGVPELGIPNPFVDPYEGMTPLKKELSQLAKPFDKLLNNRTPLEQEVLWDRKHLVDSADCTLLLELYHGNPNWSLLPYVAQKIIEMGCVV